MQDQEDGVDIDDEDQINERKPAASKIASSRKILFMKRWQMMDQEDGVDGMKSAVNAKKGGRNKPM